MEDTAQPPQAGLSPPWYTLWNEINSAIGADPGFEVQPLSDDGNGKYSVVIMSRGGGSDPAALAAIVKKSHTLGNITVTVQVQYPQQVVLNINSADTLLGAVKSGLRANPCFVKAMKVPSSPYFPTPSVVAVFTPSVIQFYNDDLSDYYRNFNGVTADVFAQVLETNYGNNITLATTTECIRPGCNDDQGDEQGGGAQGGGQA